MRGAKCRRDGYTRLIGRPGGREVAKHANQLASSQIVEHFGQADKVRSHLLFPGVGVHEADLPTHGRDYRSSPFQRLRHFNTVLVKSNRRPPTAIPRSNLTLLT